MESIKEKLKKSKSLMKYLENGWFFAGITIVLVAFALCGAIRLSELFKNQPIVTVVEAAFDTNVSDKEGSYVASKNGGSYYFPWCGMVGRIKDENKVWFATRVEAEKAGYKPASNCHGLK